MTKLAVPAVIIATATYPTPSATPSDGHRRQGSPTVRPVASSRRGQPVDAPATTEQLLRQRDDLPAGHPERAELRTRVIEENLPLADRLARRYTGRGEPLDDLTQVAAFALIKAVDGYDPSLRSPFARYAVPSILGALKRHFRDATWGVRVPRRTQELTRDIATATGELSQQRGRCPTHAELADHLHVSAVDILAAVGASQAYRLMEAVGSAAGRLDAG